MSVKKILKRIANKFSKFKLKSETEAEFYENLFISNDSWNKSTPNIDELKRWGVIEYFIKKINSQNDPNILDLGCGRGWLTNLLSSYGRVLGIEPVGKVVKHARNLFPHIAFVEGKASSLVNEYSEKFDFIVSSEVIEHILNKEKEVFVEEIKLLLKSNGYLIVSTPRKEAQNDWRKHNNPSQPIEEWVSEKELKELFEKLGFKLLEVKRISRKPKNHPNLIDLYQVCLFQKLA